MAKPTTTGFLCVAHEREADGRMPQIDHVVVLALENRSFDHLLGYLDHPHPAFDGVQRDRLRTNPAWGGVSRIAVSPDAKSVVPVSPDHSHDGAMLQLGLTGKLSGSRPRNDGFVTSYERMCRGLCPPAFGGLLGPVINWWLSRRPPPPAIVGRGPLVMACQDPSSVPVLSELARQFAVCTRWFSSVPGETWPNRNFMHAATSDGDADVNPRLYTNKTIFEVLEEHNRDWHIYYDDTPQAWAFVHLWDSPERAAKWFDFAEFDRHVSAGQLPSYSFIEPNHRPPLHTFSHEPVVGAPDVSNNQHPSNNLVPNASYDDAPPVQPGDFTRAEQLIASVYESLRANPEVFERTVLLVTYDEHGGFYDHVPPPTGVPNPGCNPGRWQRLMRAVCHRRTAAFDFSVLGPRVPTVIISPYVEAGTVSTDVRDHASIPSTLRALFAPGAAALTSRDAWAKPFHDVLGRSTPRPVADLPDLSSYAAGMAPSATLGAASAPHRADAPPHYQPFVELADNVARRLEVMGVADDVGISSGPGIHRAGRTVDAFRLTAARSRTAEASQR